jgi:N-carbamoyl-L-amino-acid hydrolase
MNISVKLDRLQKDILDLGQIGLNPEGGISRPSFSPADLEARHWLKDRILAAGLEYRQDGAGNIFGYLEGNGGTVMAGSHLDSVINGGMFDGPAGVLTALECLRRIKEEGLAHNKPLAAAAFTDEEGNLAGDFLGARAFTGTLNRDMLEKGLTQFGVPLTDILENTQFTLDSIFSASRERPELAAFIELHIEQGPVLETEDKEIGIVDRIAGKNYWLCRFQGKAGHAGTTPFELRQDAFLGLADFALKSTQYVATHHYGSMVTVGKASLHPGSFSIVPERVEFSLDFRSTSAETLDTIAETLKNLAQDTATTRGLGFDFRLMDKTAPVEIPAYLRDLLTEICLSQGYSHMLLPSGAGHDAQILAGITDAAMIFIPCEDGVSHSPQENIRWEHLEKGANLLLHALLHLAA